MKREKIIKGIGIVLLKKIYIYNILRIRKI